MMDEQKKKKLPKLPSIWNVSKNQLKSISGKIRVNKRKENKLKALFDKIRELDNNIVLGNNALVYLKGGKSEFVCYYTERPMLNFIKQGD
jgi:hypothetical protein